MTPHVAPSSSAVECSWPTGIVEHMGRCSGHWRPTDVSHLNMNIQFTPYWWLLVKYSCCTVVTRMKVVSDQLTTGRVCPRPTSICLAGTCTISNQIIRTVTSVGGLLAESCSLGSLHHAIVWIHEQTTVNNWREKVEMTT